MKKIFFAVIAVLLVISFAACSDKEPVNETTTEETSSVPVVSLKTDNTAVKAGESVEIVVNISQSPLTACFDIYVVSDSLLIYEKNSASAGEMMMAANFKEEDGVERVAIRGISAQTFDLPDNDVCTITYKVSEEAVTGDVINIVLQVPSYQLGLDESGNDVYSVNEELTLNNITLTVE